MPQDRFSVVCGELGNKAPQAPENAKGELNARPLHQDFT
jgi:hypothetical protein